MPLLSKVQGGAQQQPVAQPQQTTPQPGGLSPAMSGLKQEWNTPGLTAPERLGIMGAGMWQEGGDMLKSMGIRGGATALGQVVGRRFGGPFGERAGGALGAGVGDVVDQYRQMSNDPSKTFSMGQLAGDVTAGAFLGKSTAGASVPAVAGQSAMAGGANALAANVQSMASGKGLLPLGQTAEQFNVGSLGQLAAKPLDRGATAESTRLATNEGAPMRRVLSDAEDLGMVVPPVVSNPSLGNKAAHVIGGGSDVINAAKAVNGPAAIQAIRDELGFKPGQELSTEALNARAIGTNIVWNKIGSVSPEAQLAMNQYKDLTAKANDAFRSYNSSQIKLPAALEEAKGLAAQAESAASDLKQALKDKGQSPLWDEFQSSRKMRAQIELAKEAISPGGEINPDVFGNAFENGRPLTGKLNQLGRVQSQFSKYVAANPATPSGNIFGGVTKLGAGALVGFGVGGIPGAAIGALTVPPAVRLGILSGPGQRAFATPFYGSTAPDFAAQMAKYGALSAGRNEQ